MEDSARIIQRSHDQFYLGEHNAENPKEVFKFVGSIINESAPSQGQGLSIADWGCAVGAFPYYLQKEFPKARVVGFEFLDSLLDEAKSRFPTMDFRSGSLLDSESNNEQFDITTVLGVISIFDNIEPALQNLVRWTKKGGKILIHGMFNKEDVDVYIKYALSSNYDTNTLEAGWNIVSRSTITRLLLDLGVTSIKFHDFVIGIDLPRNANDPLRSWTEKGEDRVRYITNGLSLIQPQAILEITV